jgi:hypothetical protein
MGKSSGSQTTTQKTELPAWYTNAATKAINFSQSAAKNISQPYMGNTVADLNSMQQNAIDLTGQNVGGTNGAYNAAQGGAMGAMNYNPSQVYGGSFLTGDVGAYMNPYIQNVEQAAMGNLDQSFRKNLNTIADQSINSHAFGGSRQGVQEGAAAAEYARQAGDLSAQLRGQGYTAATDLMGQDLTRNYNSQVANQNAGLQGAQLNLQGASDLGTLSSNGQAAYLQSLNSALAAGQITQQQAQQLLDQSANQYNAMRQVPNEQLNLMLSALGGTQVPTSSTTKQPTTGNTAGSILGGIGSVIGGLGAAGIISDERMKTNIQHLGVDGITGLPVYAYDYKSDVAHARKTGQPMPPKRVGPMAQDIEKKAPDRVREIGGKKVVNFGFGG